MSVWQELGILVIYVYPRSDIPFRLRLAAKDIVGAGQDTKGSGDLFKKAEGDKICFSTILYCTIQYSNGTTEFDGGTTIG